MILYGVPAVVASAFTLLLGVFVYLRNSKNVVNISFFRWLLALSIWHVGSALTYFVNASSAGLFASRLTHAGAILIPATFLHFIISFLGLNGLRRRVILLSYVVTFLLEIANVTSFFIKDVSRLTYNYYGIPGVLYPIFVIFFFLIVVYCLFCLYRSFVVATGRRKPQLKYLLVASVIGYGGGAIDFLPIFNIDVYAVGNPMNIVFVSLVAYAILKHNLMDIEVIIKKTLIFAGLVGTVACVIALPIAIIQLVIGGAVGISPFWLMISAIVTTVLLYRPLERFLIQLTDRFLFQKKYDYKKILKDASSGISQIKSLHELLSLVVHFITMRIRVNNAAILVHDEKNHYFQFAYSRGYPKHNWLREGHIINLDDPLIEYLSRERAPLEIEHVKEYAEAGGHSYDFRAIKNRMEELKASLAVPSFLGQRFLGTLLLGEKKSGDFYTDEDQAILFTIGQESAIAIENARLYDEAIEKAKELELINTELNSAQTKVFRALKEAEVANKQLKQTQVELIEAKKRALLAGISSAVGHEIRNPLTPVMGHLYYVLKSLDDANHLYDALASRLTEAERERFLAVISTLNRRFTGVQRGSERIRGVVNTLINLVKERSDTKAEVQLKLVIASALEEVRFQTYWDSLTIPKIVVDIPADLPFISGITQDLQGVFVNLIINSLHAMEKTLEKQITIKAKVDSENPKMIRIDFTDNGCGISKELQNKIFEHGFTTKGEKGTGIGLFYCKDNVERVHGGTIAVRSEVGIGTSFMIRLPIFRSYDEARGSGAQAVGT